MTRGGKKGSGWEWRVDFLRAGVGGFGVGVADVRLPFPYKSLGNQPLSWIWHMNGECLHNRTRVSLPKGEFEEGDTLGVTLSPSGELGLIRNGARTGGSKAPVLPPGKYVLCCQPYMGGAARLQEARRT